MGGAYFPAGAAVAVALAAGAGCYHPSPQAGAPCSESGTCPTGLKCVGLVCVDPDAPPVDAAIDACPELSCLGGDLAGCNSRITCSLGCADATPNASAHCMQMVPSNGVTDDLLAGATADLDQLDVELDTETGEITYENGTPLRTAGTGVIAGIGFTVIDRMGVFTVHAAHAPVFVNGPGDDWDVNGTNGLVVFAATTITVDGRIDVGGSGQGGGAGGSSGATTGSVGPPCRGKAGLWQATGFGEGGGGAGGRVAGANGAVSNTTTFGAGGPACSAGPTTIPLVGGNGGGAGGVETAAVPDVVHGGDGGGGGGALALVAMESITITGEVGAPGAGGLTTATGDGGGGGGGGGAVLLESPVITISSTGKLTANGGGGAGPSGANGSNGHTSDASQAAGGVFMTGAGGKGGTMLAPTAGTNFTDGTTARGGGGGGAAGRTEIKARTKVTTGALMSPGPALTDITAK